MCGDGLPAAGQQCSARAIKHGRAGCRAGCRSQVAGCRLQPCRTGQGRAGQGPRRSDSVGCNHEREDDDDDADELPPTSYLYVPDLAP